MAEETVVEEVNKEDTLLAEKPAEEGAPKEGAEETPNKGAEDGQADKAKAEGAPENYEDFKLPEGVEANKELTEAFVPIAKDLNLTQEQAQKLVDLQVEQSQRDAKATEEAWATTKNEWETAAKADEEIGGEKLEEQIGLAKKALDKFGTKELMEALEITGTGSHPEFLRVFARVGKAISEDAIISGKEQSGELSLEKRLFPNQN